MQLRELVNNEVLQHCLTNSDATLKALACAFGVDHRPLRDVAQVREAVVQRLAFGEARVVVDEWEHR